MDERTALQVRLLLERCAARGSDIVRALDERFHLLYPLRQRQIQANTLRQVADMLAHTSVKQLQGGHTPLDVKNAVERWLREQAVHLDNQTDDEPTTTQA